MKSNIAADSWALVRVPPQRAMQAYQEVRRGGSEEVNRSWALVSAVIEGNDSGYVNAGNHQVMFNDQDLIG